MTQPFFGTGTGNNQKLIRILGLQAADGIPQEDKTKLIPFLSNGGAVSPSPQWIEAQKITARKMRRTPITSKIDLQNQKLNLGDLDVGSHAALWLIANALGYKTTSNPDTGAYMHRMSAAADDLVSTKKLTYINDADLGIPMRLVDGICKGFQLSLAPRQNAKLDCDVRFGKLDFWGDATVTGTGTVPPRLRHFTSDNWDPDSTDKDFFVKIITESATAVTYKIKIASAGSYGATRSATKGKWAYTGYGPRRNEIMVLFDASVDGTYVVDDEWEFTKRRVIDLNDYVDYDTERNLAEVQARFFLDDEEVSIDNGVTVAVDNEEAITRYAVGGEQAVGTFVTGFQNVTVNLDRRLVDLDLQRALMTRDNVSLVIEGQTDDLIASTALYYGYDIICPNVIFQGSMHDVEEGGTNRNETLVGMCKEPETPYTWKTIDVSADIEVRALGSIATPWA